MQIMFRAYRRLLNAVSETPAVELRAKPRAGVLPRVRSFVSGALFASAAGMYVITFQLQGLLDEVRSAVHDVSIRQQLIETKLAQLNPPPQ
jgi:hypothetical protein